MKKTKNFKIEEIVIDENNEKRYWHRSDYVILNVLRYRLDADIPTARKTIECAQRIPQDRFYIGGSSKIFFDSRADLIKKIESAAAKLLAEREAEREKRKKEKAEKKSQPDHRYMAWLWCSHCHKNYYGAVGDRPYVGRHGDYSSPYAWSTCPTCGGESDEEEETH